LLDGPEHELGATGMWAQNSGLRHLTQAEQLLVTCLLERVPAGARPSARLDELLVMPMNDGGMGSLRFMRDAESEQGRRMGACLSQIEFDDADGVRVLASLDHDEQGELFELEIWKVDFRPLLRLPE
jgi:hypothetical protein